MTSYPHAKINIGLSITGKRSDGFHNIETVFYPVPLYDTLVVEPAGNEANEKINFVCEGIELPDTAAQKNLCCKAYNLLDTDFDLPPTNISLNKVIPVGAGLGGGSSDAAYTLKALNDLYKLQISDDELANYARRLGSDCTFFLQQTPAFGIGKGEILKPLSLSLDGYYVLIVKPPVFISTAEAYSAVVPQKSPYYLPELLKTPINDWRRTVFNDFEESVFKKFPEIGKIKERLYGEGAVYASLSGSGASVYGIFKDNPEEIAKMFGECFCFCKNITH